MAKRPTQPPQIPIDRARLTKEEAAVYDRYADTDGSIDKRYIDAVLRHNIALRQILAKIVVGAGFMKCNDAGQLVVEVHADTIEQAAAHADFYNLEHFEDDGSIRH